jgi:hypothetical protein
MAQLGRANRVHAGRPAPEMLTYNEAITPVVHIGDICQNGTLCDLGLDNPVVPRRDRSLLDFFQVAIDREGRAHLAFGDNAAAPGQSISAYSVQLTGVSLRTGRELPRLRMKYDKLRCAANAAFTDPAGDANEVLVTNTPAPSEPAVDVVRSYLTWDAQHRTVTFHVRVKDLAADPPTGSTGEAIDYEFGLGGKGYDLFGRHDTSGDTTDIESPVRSSVSDDVKFRVDKAHDEFTFTIAHDALAKIDDPAKRGPVIGPGSKITGLKITMRRSEAGKVVPNVDEAAGVCPFIVPDSGSVTAVAVPSGGGDDGFLPAAPTLPVPSQLRDFLVSLLFALLIGACVTVRTGRGRQALAG